MAVLRVISANRLADGVVVYYQQPGERSGRWVESFGEASIFEDENAFGAALARAKQDERANLVLDLAPVEALCEAGKPRPERLREAIRAAGPTVHRDHGKQAVQIPPRRL